MEKREQYRQGDVLVIPLSGASYTTVPCSIPEKTTPDPDVLTGDAILAHGEVTGHAHRIHGKGECFLKSPESEDGFLLLDTNLTSLLKHEEHHPISLAPGSYVTRRQLVYTKLYGSRTVVD